MSQRIALEIEVSVGQPFIYGVNDCATRCANIIHDVLGYDPALLRGKYGTLDGAARLMGWRGIFGAVSDVAKNHGWRRILSARASPGDIGIATVSNGIAIVIFNGTHFIGWIEYGFSIIPKSQVKKCWSVLPQ